MSKRSAVGFFLILSAVFVLHFTGWLAPAENFGRGLFLPLNKGVYQFNLVSQNFFKRFWKQSEIFEENNACAERLKKLALERTELELLRQENFSLRALLNFSKFNKKIVLAEVAGKSADGASNALLINRGAADNIAPGNPVVAEDGFLVGTVARTEKNISFIRLVTDNQSRLSAAALNQNKVLGVVKGEHGISLKMIMIPQNEEIEKDDLIITAGLETNVPRGLLIGRVSLVEKEIYQPFQSARLETFLDVNKLSLVAVLINE